jgi:hypothetical protein
MRNAWSSVRRGYGRFAGFAIWYDVEATRPPVEFFVRKTSYDGDESAQTALFP